MKSSEERFHQLPGSADLWPFFSITVNQESSFPGQQYKQLPAAAQYVDISIPGYLLQRVQAKYPECLNLVVLDGMGTVATFIDGDYSMLLPLRELLEGNTFCFYVLLLSRSSILKCCVFTVHEQQDKYFLVGETIYAAQMYTSEDSKNIAFYPARDVYDDIFVSLVWYKYYLHQLDFYQVIAKHLVSQELLASGFFLAEGYIKDWGHVLYHPQDENVHIRFLMWLPQFDGAYAYILSGDYAGNVAWVPSTVLSAYKLSMIFTYGHDGYLRVCPRVEVAVDGIVEGTDDPFGCNLTVRSLLGGGL